MLFNTDHKSEYLFLKQKDYLKIDFYSYITNKAILLRYTHIATLLLFFLCGLAPSLIKAETNNVRYIPIRAFALVDDQCTINGPQCGSSCDGAAGITRAQLTKSIDIANQTWDAIGVEYYVRSFKRVQAPKLWCAANHNYYWFLIRDEIRNAFPEVPSNAWSALDVNPKWFNAAATVYAPDDELIMTFHKDLNPKTKSSGTFPHAGRLISMINGHMSNGGNTFNHELGHYFGLVHTPDSLAQGNGLAPDGSNWLLSDLWDLIYRETNDGPQFFSNPSEAARFESELKLIRRLIPQINEDGKTEYVPANCFFNNPCEVACYLSGEVVPYSDPRLAGITRLSKQKNVMDKSVTGSCDAYLSDSQLVTADIYLNYEARNDSLIDKLPKRTNAQNLVSGRTRLGLVREINHHYNRNFCVASDEHLYIGDFNGDGRDDLLCNQDDGDMFIDLANKKGEFWSSNWRKSRRNFCVASDEHLYIGDFNGDGRDDLLCNQDDGDMFVDLANKKGEFWSSNWRKFGRNFCVTSGEHLYIGDFNGDGREDLLCNQDDGEMFIDLANTKGEFWSSNRQIVRNFCTAHSDVLFAGDVNNDDRDDIICHNSSTGHIEVDLANPNAEFYGSEFAGELNNWCSGNEIHNLIIGNADGKDGIDLLCNWQDGKLDVAFLRMDYKERVDPNLLNQ